MPQNCFWIPKLKPRDERLILRDILLPKSEKTTVDTGDSRRSSTLQTVGRSFSFLLPFSLVLLSLFFFSSGDYDCRQILCNFSVLAYVAVWDWWAKNPHLFAQTELKLFSMKIGTKQPKGHLLASKNWYSLVIPTPTPIFGVIPTPTPVSSVIPNPTPISSIYPQYPPFTPNSNDFDSSPTHYSATNPLFSDKQNTTKIWLRFGHGSLGLGRKLRCLFVEIWSEIGVGLG
jgi:hypothetical protein